MAKNSWNIDMIGNQKAKVAVVTGSTSGIGLETARVLAHKEATVIMAVRNLAKGQSAADQIIDESRNQDVRPMELDLADLASIRAGVEDMEAGRVRPIAEVADEIRRKHGWQSES